MAHNIFISYAKEDRQAADLICSTLESAGIQCWYAPRDIPYAANFEDSIVDAISASQLMILILSSHSNDSAHVNREIKIACMEGIGVPVLPVCIEDVSLNKSLKYYLGSVQRLDASIPPLRNHLKHLIEHVQAHVYPSSPGADLTDASPSVATNVPIQEAKVAATPAVKTVALQTDTGSIIKSQELSRGYKTKPGIWPLRLMSRSVRIIAVIACSAIITAIYLSIPSYKPPAANDNTPLRIDPDAQPVQPAPPVTGQGEQNISANSASPTNEDRNEGKSGANRKTESGASRGTSNAQRSDKRNQNAKEPPSNSNYEEDEPPPLPTPEKKKVKPSNSMPQESP